MWLSKLVKGMQKSLSSSSSIAVLVSFATLMLPLQPGISHAEDQDSPVKEAGDAPVAVSFEKQIKPVLEEKCMHCHNRETLPDRISFENAKLAFATTKDGKIYIVPGKPEASLLIAAIEKPLFHEMLMPMVGPRLTAEEVVVFRRWVTEGAKWPEGKAGDVKVTFRAD